ncbi:MAG: SulP family inorganic anion transporter, partial [Planctomycetota bacterium]
MTEAAPTPADDKPHHWSNDLVAGVSVAAVLVPQGMAYAELAGLPPHHGLYAGTLPLIAMALFASCRHLQIGPVALSSLLVLGALTPLATTESKEYVGLAALLALVVGVLRFCIGLFRVGFVVDLLSRGVIRGFVPAAAIVILSTQLPSVFGVPVSDGTILEKAGAALSDPGLWSAEALGMAGMTAVLVFGGRRIHPVFPGVLLAVITGVLWSQFAGYEGRTVERIDGVMFPPISFDLPWHRIPDLLIP